MPLLLFKFLTVQAFGCYHLARGCRVSVLLEGGTKFFFFFPKLGSDGQRKKEAGVLGKFRGVPEVRAAQQHYAYLPFLLVWSSMPWVPADDPGTRPGPRWALSFSPTAWSTHLRQGTQPALVRLDPAWEGWGDPSPSKGWTEAHFRPRLRKPGLPKLIISPRRRVCVCLISHW